MREYSCQTLSEKFIHISMDNNIEVYTYRLGSRIMRPRPIIVNIKVKEKNLMILEPCEQSY